MNFFNDFSKQVAALFESMSASARIMAGLMLGVILVSLGWIFTAQSTTSSEFLFGGKDYTDAELELWEATFGEAKLRDYERIGQRIKVPAGKKDLYLKALNSANAMPMEWGSHVENAFSSVSPFDSTYLTDKRTEAARERDVAYLIQSIPGIAFAAVEYDEQRAGFARNTVRVCSVSVRAHGNAPVPAETLKKISQKVQFTFAGLSPENIMVTDLGGLQNYHATGDPHSVEENPYLKAQSQWEAKYSEKVSNVLSNYGMVQLAVNVELDPTLAEASEKLRYDPTPVTVSSSESRKDLENAKAAPAGPPGAASNGVSNQPQTINGMAAGQTSNVKESEANERRVAGHEAIVTKLAGLVPKKVFVTVGIPDSYYRKVWAYRAARDNPDPNTAPPPATPTELAELKIEVEGSVRAAVEGIPVGTSNGDDSKPSINVYSYTDLPVPEFQEPGLTAQATAWFAESWSTLALLVVVFASLGMMFSWIKSQSGAASVDSKFEDAFGLEVPGDLSDELDLSQGDTIGEDGNVIPGGRSKPEFQIVGGEIKEDLSTLIKENPDAAVNLLKSWIGEAA